MKQQQIEYLEFLLNPLFSAHPRAAWQPAADVYRCRTGWLVKFDIAGVRQEDIEIRMIGASLSVSGTRRDKCVYGHVKSHSMEIAYSRFERLVELPEEIVSADIRSEYQDGMLLVHVEVKQEAET